MGLVLGDEKCDLEWGCSHYEIADSLGYRDVKICLVSVRSLKDFSEKLTGTVLDTSWMMSLDRGVRRQYDYTVRETAAALVEVFGKLARKEL